MTVAILGAGLLGSCTALELAERGVAVHLFERNAEALHEASYWNEGKLHLGFVYANDPSQKTTLQMLEGAFSFAASLSRWIDSSALEAMLSDPFDYIVYRDSMLSVPEVERHFDFVSDRIRERQAQGGSYPGYRDGALYQPMARADIAERYNPDAVLGAYRTVERAIDGWAVAAVLRQALANHPRIEFITGARVIAVEDSAGEQFTVVYDADGPQRQGPYESVVNALWANRLLIDNARGLRPGRPWLNRFKLGVNYRVDPKSLRVPTMTLMLGPFGDVVHFPTGRVYISWYPAGLIGMSGQLEEIDWSKILSTVDVERVRVESEQVLSGICPQVAQLADATSEPPLANGGAIFAWGKSDIDDPDSVLHQRYEVGVHSHGRYHTVDTGKYTLAPMFAQDAANRIQPAARSMAAGAV